MVRGTKKHQHVDHYIAKLCKNGCRKPLKSAISLEPGDMVLAKADAYRWRRKVKDWWKEKLYEVEC